MNDCYRLTVAELKALLALHQVPGRSRFTTKPQICYELIRLGLLPPSPSPALTPTPTQTPAPTPTSTSTPTPTPTPAPTQTPTPVSTSISTPVPIPTPTSTLRYITRPLQQLSRQPLSQRGVEEKTVTQEELNDRRLLQQAVPKASSIELQTSPGPIISARSRRETPEQRSRRETPEQRRRRAEILRQQEILMRQRNEKEQEIQQKLTNIINRNRDQLIRTCLKYRVSELVERTQGKQEQGGSKEEEICRDEELWRALMRYDYKTDQKLVDNSSWFNNYRILRTKDVALNRLITAQNISQVLKRGMPRLMISKEALEYLQNYLKQVVNILIILPNDKEIVIEFLQDYFELSPNLLQHVLIKYNNISQFPTIINALLEQIGNRGRKQVGTNLYIDVVKMRQIVEE